MKFEGCIQSYMLPWKLRNRQILPVNKHLLSVYFSLAKFKLVSCDIALDMIWQMTYTHKLPKQCSATLSKIAAVSLDTKTYITQITRQIPIRLYNY